MKKTCLFFDFDGVISIARSMFSERTLVDGMDEIIKAAAEKHTLAIVSSMNIHSLEQFLRQEKLLEHFSFIKGYDKGKPKEDHCTAILEELSISPKNSLFITDSSRDITEAERAGIASIAVTWGLGNAEEFEGKLLKSVVDSCEELQKAINQFFIEKR